MTHPTLRLAVAFGLAAATLGGTIASPAYAQYEGPRQPNHRGNAWNQGPAYRTAPPMQGYSNYYRQPDVYYSAPPVVVVPQGYYQQPAPLLFFSFPVVIR